MFYFLYNSFQKDCPKQFKSGQNGGHFGKSFQSVLSCDLKKLEAVVNWPKPSCVKEVRSFLGCCSYYKSFVQGFSNWASPLYELTKKNVKLEWTSACEEAFERLKDRLVSSPILAYPKNDILFVLDTDASSYGSGAVLSQVQENGEEKVIAYGNKSLSKTQRNYCTTMKELLTCVVFVKQLYHYLWGRQDKDISDMTELKSAGHTKPQKSELNGQSELFKCLCAQWSVLKVDRGLLVRESVAENSSNSSVNQYVVPLAMKKEILHHLEGDRIGGHFGVRRTLCKLRTRFYWPGYKHDIVRWCQRCKVCESFKTGHNPKKAPLKLQLVGAPQERIACDIMGPVVQSKNGNNCILVIQDYFSKFVEAYRIPDQTAQTVADCLVTQ